jgi:hypothetical protein
MKTLLNFQSYFTPDHHKNLSALDTMNLFTSNSCSERLPQTQSIRMSNTRFLKASFRGALVTLILALAGFSAAPNAQAQPANVNPPERMSYQGFLADGNGLALATNAPKNYDVIFRIYNDATASAAANLIWSEQQSVTVDKGYYSVLLGEGTQVNVEPRNEISTVFTNATASDRYMEMTVKGIGSGNTDVKLLPRLRLLSSPYAYLARNAVNATSASKLVNSTGADLVTSTGTNLTIVGTLSASTINAAGLIGLTASQIPNLDASKITTGTFPDGRLSANVALYNATAGFTAPQSFKGGISVDSGNGFGQSSLGAFNVDGPGVVGGRFTVQPNGAVGIGVNSGTYGLLSVGGLGYSDGTFNLRARNSDNAIMAVFRRANATGGNGAGSECLRMEDFGSGFALQVYQGNVYKPGGGSWGAVSDARLKHNIQPLRGSLEKLLKLRSVTFEYNDNVPEAGGLKGTQIGFIAQEVEKVFPAWVGQSEKTGYKTVSITGFESLTVQAFRELRAEMDNQIKERDEKIATLDKRLSELEAREKGRVALEQEISDLKKMVAQLMDSRGSTKIKTASLQR